LVPASGSRPDIVPRAFNTKIRQKYNTIAWWLGQSCPSRAQRGKGPFLTSLPTPHIHRNTQGYSVGESGEVKGRATFYTNLKNFLWIFSFSKIVNLGWWYNSVVAHLPTMCETLGSIKEKRGLVAMVQVVEYLPSKWKVLSSISSTIKISNIKIEN
jgi:hypothetical protein